MTMQQPGSGVAERPGRRTWMLVVGVLVLVGMIGAAAALWVASGQRRADNVAAFARAPAGCETTLDFAGSGTFVLYLETSGEFETIDGACDAELRYDRDPDDVPETTLTLLDPSGDELTLQDADEVVYDVDGFVGSSTRQVQIEATGDHVLVAPAEGDPFAVAIGRSPDEGVALLRWGALGAALVGLVLGGVLLTLGGRRRPAVAVPTPAWTPDGTGWPASPPGFPVPPPTTGASGPPGPPLGAPSSPPLVSGPPSSVPGQPPMPGDGRLSPWAPPPPPR